MNSTQLHVLKYTIGLSLSLPYQSYPPDKQLCTLPASHHHHTPPQPGRVHSNVLQVVVCLSGLGSISFLRDVGFLLYPHTVFILPNPTLPDLPLNKLGPVAPLGPFLHLPHENIGATE